MSSQSTGVGGRSSGRLQRGQSFTQDESERILETPLSQQPPAPIGGSPSATDTKENRTGRQAIVKPDPSETPFKRPAPPSSSQRSSRLVKPEPVQTTVAPVAMDVDTQPADLTMSTLEAESQPAAPTRKRRPARTESNIPRKKKVLFDDTQSEAERQRIRQQYREVEEKITGTASFFIVECRGTSLIRIILCRIHLSHVIEQRAQLTKPTSDGVLDLLDTLDNVHGRGESVFFTCSYETGSVVL